MEDADFNKILLVVVVASALCILVTTFFMDSIVQAEGRTICALTNGPHSEYQGIKDFDIFTGNFSVSCSRMLPPGFG